MADELDTLSSTAPALSATSDMPVVDAPAPTETPAETPAQTPNEPVAPAETPADGVDSADAAAAKEPRGVGKKLAEQQAAIEAERTRADAAMAELEAARAELAKLAPKPLEKPTREAFTDPNAYDEALAAWAKQQGLIEAAQQRQQQASETAQREVVTAWQAKVAAAEAENPQWREVALADNVAITPAMSSAITVADNGTDIAFHLGANPQEAARIAALPPGRQVFEIGKLAASLAAKPKAQVSKAPPPIVPLGSRARAAEKTADEESMEEYAARRTQQLRGGGRAAALN